jgi:hypothetical protein
MEKGEAMMNENDNLESTQKTGNAIAGFFCAGLFAVVILIVSWVLGFLVSIKSDTFFIVAISVSGIVAGILLWALFRGSRFNFARGALIFTVVCFVVTGACWIIPPIQIGR